MSTTSRSLGGGWGEPGARFGDDGEHNELQAQHYGEDHDARAHVASAGNGGGSRKKRRRQRAQRSKRHRSNPGRPSIALDLVSRESMFQDVEGLLRQIRERAEETAEWTAEQLNDFTHTVTTFMKSLEEETEQVSERARSEYQRIRDKLSQALRG